jgi:hypothetical protein
MHPADKSKMDEEFQKWWDDYRKGHQYKSMYTMPSFLECWEAATEPKLAEIKTYRKIIADVAYECSINDGKVDLLKILNNNGMDFPHD